MDDHSGGGGNRWILFGGTVFLAMVTVAAMAMLAAFQAQIAELWVGLFATLAVLLVNVVLISVSRETARLHFSRFLLWLGLLGHFAVYALAILRIVGLLR